MEGQGGVTHQEINEVKSQLLTMATKIEGIAGSLISIQTLLAEQRGERFPARIGELEDDMIKVQTYKAGMEWLPAVVRENQADIKALNKFQYMALGGLTLLNTIMVVAGHFILNSIFHTVQP